MGVAESGQEDFSVVVWEGWTCGDCKHCQMNKRVKERTMGWYCYHEDNLQQHLHNRQSMQVSKDFLCNRFEFHQEVGDKNESKNRL